MCSVPPIHFNVTTSSTNLLKAINNINIVLPGGGSWEDGGWSVWVAGGLWPGSAAPGPERSPSAAGSALFLASGRDPASRCGSSPGLVSQRADPSSPVAPALSPPWLLPAPLQLLVYVHRALPSHLLSGREAKIFDFCSVQLLLPFTKVIGKVHGYWPAAECDWVPPCLWLGLRSGQPFWPVNLLGQPPDSAVCWGLTHVWHSVTPSAEYSHEYWRIWNLRENLVMWIRLPGARTKQCTLLRARARLALSSSNTSFCRVIWPRASLTVTSSLRRSECFPSSSSRLLSLKHKMTLSHCFFVSHTRRLFI